MKSRTALQARDRSVFILLAATALLLLQLPGGGVVTATEPNEAMSEAPALAPAANSTTAELVDQRDYNTRVWSVREEAVLQRDDGTQEAEIEERRVVEVGSGICYVDAQGKFQPSNPHWEPTSDGFVLRECAYGLSAGKTLADPIVYTTQGSEFRFRPAFLKASAGSTVEVVASVDTSVTAVVDAEDPTRLVFRRALGDLADVEILAKKGSLHQNLILNGRRRTRLDTQAGDARLSLYTELSLDEFLAEQGAEVRFASSVMRGIGSNLDVAPSKESPIGFYKTESDGAGNPRDVLHHFFAESPVYAAADGEPAAFVGEKTERGLVRDLATNATYLVESVPLAFLDNADYPLIWDFCNIPAYYQPGEPWIPSITYHVTADFYVTSGTLQILPGTVVKLDPNVSIYASGGAIHAKGEPYDYIVFTKTRDDNCGEIITGVPSDPYMCAIYLMSGSPATSVVQYCKMGYGYFGVICQRSLDDLNPDTDDSIAHNVIRGQNVLWMGIKVGSGANTSCHNNLITDSTWLGIQYYSSGSGQTSITNNTINRANVGIQLNYSTFDRVTDNLVTNTVFCGIDVTTSTVGLLDHNGFWMVAAPVAGGSMGPHSVDLPDPKNPYDPCSVGEFYLDNITGEGAELRNRPGGRNAEEAGLLGEQFTVNRPNPAPPLITSNATWGKIATDTGIVDIGYHHNRVDWLLDNQDTVVQNSALIVEPGTVVAIHGYGRELYIGGQGRMLSVGNGQGGEQVLFASKRSVSMLMDASFMPPQLPGQEPNQDQTGIWLRPNSSFASEVRDTDFRGLNIGVKTELRTIAPLWGNRSFCCKGSGVRVAGDALPDVRNNLLTNCGNGIAVDCYSSDAVTVLDLNTLDHCSYGVWIWGGGVEEEYPVSYVLNSLFTFNSISGVGYVPEFGFHYSIDHCGYWGNTQDLQPPLGQGESNRVPISSPPYDPSGEPYGRWFLEQAGGAVDSTWHDPVSLGFGPHTTAVDGRLDRGMADIGYHYPSSDPPLAGPEAPSAIILSPEPAATITGSTLITVHAEDAIGVNPGVSEVHLFWNGHHVLGAYPDAEDTFSFTGEWETNTAANGEGTLLAVAVDYDGDIGVSPPIALTADNLITCLSANQRSINTDLGETLAVAAILSQVVPWDLKIVNPDDEGAPPFANVASGQGLYMFAQWDGTDDFGQPLGDAPYEYRLHAGTSSQTATGTAAVQRTPGFAIEVALFAPYDEPIDRKLFRRLNQTFSAAGIASRSFFGKDASWENFQYHIAGDNYCYVLLYSGHGRLLWRGGTRVGHAFRLWAGAGAKTLIYDVNANAPSNYPRTIERLGMAASGKMKLVYMDACRLGETWPDHGTSNIAIQFGVYSGAGGDQDQAYVGFTDKVYWHTAIGFTDMFFDYLVNGRMSVDQALLATKLNSTRTDRVDRVRGQQGVWPWWCWIPPM